MKSEFYSISDRFPVWESGLQQNDDMTSSFVTEEDTYAHHVIGEISCINDGPAIVKLLRRRGTLAQVQIGSQLGITPATLSRMIRRLRESKLVLRTTNNERNSTRSGVALNPGVGHVIGVEYTPSLIHIAAISFDGKLLHTQSNGINANTPQELLQAIASAINGFMTQHDLSPQRLLGIGAIDYGVVDAKTGIAVKSSLFPAWQDVHVMEYLVELFNVPVTLMSSMMARFFAVDYLDLHTRFDDFVLVEYGMGIACGVKAGGRYITGSRGMAGELGHVHVPNFDGPCGCGSIGCLEAAAALPALAREAGCEGREVLIRAKAGDKRMSRIVDQAYQRIGTALGTVVNVLNPAAIVLDPVLAEAGELAIATLKSAMLQQMLASHSRHLEILISNLEGPIAPIGGALLVLDKILDHSHPLG